MTRGKSRSAGVERKRQRRRVAAERKAEATPVRGMPEERAVDAAVMSPRPAAANPPGRSAAAPARTHSSRPGAEDLVCERCAEPIEVRSRGPLPRWCSATCRQRAWEERRALRSLGHEAGARKLHPSTVRLDTEGWLEQLEALRAQIDEGHLDASSLVGLLDGVRAALVARTR